MYEEDPLHRPYSPSNRPPPDSMIWLAILALIALTVALFFGVMLQWAK